MEENQEQYHKTYITPYELWGRAITSTYERNDGTLWVSNEEYASQVNYCPITGYEAKTKINNPICY